MSDKREKIKQIHVNWVSALTEVPNYGNLPIRK